LQKDLDRLGEWAAENVMQINPSKCKAVRFTRARVKDPLNYTLGNQLIPEVNSCKYLGIILRNNLSWAGSCQLHSEKGLEGTTFQNAHTQKEE